MKYAIYNRPCLGETVSGDAALVRVMQSGLFLGIIDVLGHGDEAHQLARRVASFLDEHTCEDVAEVMTALHTFLKGSRGAAVGLARVLPDDGKLCYAGTGNTGLRKFGEREARLVSRDGVLGQNMPTPLVQEMALDKGDLVLLYTDGVSSHFRREDYPQMVTDPPARVARTVVDRFGKEHDDAACIVLRYQP